MADATGEGKESPLRVAFDRRIKLEFHGARITSDGGLLAYRELDDTFGLTATAASTLAEGRRGKNIRHRLLGLLRQAIYGRLAGYQDVNDAERLARDPAMRAIVGREGMDHVAASTSQMGRFETEWLATEANLAALTDLSGAWIDWVHECRPPDGIILDMDSSESPTYGEQEGSAWNGHFGCACYHPLFIFNQFGDLERCTLRPGNVHSAEGWRFLDGMILRDAQRMAEARGTRRIEPALDFGPVGVRILHWAWHARADLIVMSKPGHRELQELFFGSNWQKVHDRSLYTCVTVRPSDDRASFEGIRTMLVATDGSAQGIKAVELASDVAAKYGARVVLLHILLRGAAPEHLRALVDVGQLSEGTRKQLGKPGGVLAHVSDSGLGEVADRILQTATSVAKEKGVAEVKVRKVEGDPARQILDTAKREYADVIAVGDGLGEIQGIPLGSVSTKVAHLVHRFTQKVQ